MDSRTKLALSLVIVVLASGCLRKAECGNNDCEYREGCTSCPADCDCATRYQGSFCWNDKCIYQISTRVNVTSLTMMEGKVYFFGPYNAKVVRSTPGDSIDFYANGWGFEGEVISLTEGETGFSGSVTLLTAGDGYAVIDGMAPMLLREGMKATIAENTCVEVLDTQPPTTPEGSPTATFKVRNSASGEELTKTLDLMDNVFETPWGVIVTLDSFVKEPKTQQCGNINCDPLENTTICASDCLCECGQGSDGNVPGNCLDPSLSYNIIRFIPAGAKMTDAFGTRRFKQVLTHEDLDFIHDSAHGAAPIQGSDGNNYQYHEELALDGTFDASLPNHATADLGNKADNSTGAAGLSIESGMLRYLFVFDTPLDKDGDGTIDCTPGSLEASTFPLNLTFLGSNFIVSCSDFNGQMNMELADQAITVKQGMAFILQTKRGVVTFRLTGVDYTKSPPIATIEVTVVPQGQTEPKTHTIEIKLNENRPLVFPGGLSLGNMRLKDAQQRRGKWFARLSLQQLEGVQPVITGNNFLGFADWEWVINKGTDGKPIIGVAYQPLTSTTGEDMLFDGGEIAFPNDYLFVRDLKAVQDNTVVQAFVGKDFGE